MTLHKITYLLYEQQRLRPSVRGERLLQQCAPLLLERGLEGLQINVHDEHVITPPTAPRMLGPKPFAAQVNLWLTAEHIAAQSLTRPCCKKLALFCKAGKQRNGCLPNMVRTNGKRHAIGPIRPAAQACWPSPSSSARTRSLKTSGCAVGLAGSRL